MRKYGWVIAAAWMATLAAAPVAAEPVSRVTPVVLAYRAARPAVVNISAEKLVQARWGLFGGDPFEDIFPSPFTRRVPVKSLGSGVVIHRDGYIVTNAHVVRHAEKISVTMPDQTKYAAKVISTEVQHDLAVVQVLLPAGKKLPFLSLGRSDDLMVGETVIAIGNPLGYANTLTTGVISAVDRTLRFRGDVEYSGLIQTDAPINPGNSGGPLLNIRGELIGVNTAIRADAQNIGFAIPVAAVVEGLTKLLDFEQMNRVVFGAEVRQRHTPTGDELYVAAVRPGTPAAGRLQKGDVLLALNGEALGQIPAYVCAMLTARPGTKLRLKARRAARELETHVTLLAKPRPNGKILAQRLFGVTLREVTPKLARELRLSVDQGLLVVGVDEGGPADRLGVQLKDVLFQVGRHFVRDLDDLGLILEKVEPGQTVKIGIVRRNVRALATLRTRRSASRRPDRGDAI